MPVRRSLSGLPSNWRNGVSEAPARASAPRSPLTAVRSQPSVFSAAVTAVSVARAATPAAAAPTTAALAKAVASTAIAAVFPATGSGATLSGRGRGTATTGVATTSTAVTTTTTGVAATAAAITTATAARATGATTATTCAGLGLVDAQRAAHQLSALQGLDGTVLTVVIRHLHEGEAAFAAGVALQGQRAVRHITEGSEQLGNILLLSTEGEISNKNAHRPKGPIRRKSSLLSLNR